jgi:hypothetical protein
MLASPSSLNLCTSLKPLKPTCSRTPSSPDQRLNPVPPHWPRRPDDRTLSAMPVEEPRLQQTSQIQRWPPRLCHYRNAQHCRERDPLSIGLNTLGTASAEMELSGKATRHRWAGKGTSVVSHRENTQHRCAESPFNSRHSVTDMGTGDGVSCGPTSLSRPHARLSAQLGDLSRATQTLSAQPCVTPGFKGKSKCKNTCAPGSSYTHASTQWIPYHSVKRKESIKQLLHDWMSQLNNRSSS